MKRFVFIFAAISCTLGLERPLNIAHRGASGMYPEHTSLAYEKAVEQGADFVECDVSITKDLQLVCTHEPWLSKNSNVNCSRGCGPDHEDFSDRLATYVMDDDDPDNAWNDHGEITDFFTFDFTMEELKTLRRKQSYEFRDSRFDWDFTFVSFKEYLDLANQLGFGIYPELKLAAATNKILQDRGHSERVEDILVRDLNEAGFETREDACYVQAFEMTTLKRIREIGSDLKLVFLLSNPIGVTDEAIEAYKTEGVIDGLGLSKSLIVEAEDGISTRINENLVSRIKEDFELHVWTFRNERDFLLFDYGQDPHKELQRFRDLQIQGFFTDFPQTLGDFLDCSSSKATDLRLSLLLASLMILINV